AVFGPLAHVLVRLRVSPNLVTVIGTVATSAAALLLLPAGHLVIGVLAVLVLAFADSVDGLMARELGTESVFGAYLDSTMDRISDAAIFTALGLYLLWQDEQAWQGIGLALGIACVVFGMLVCCARARAEGRGISAKAGIAERADRLVFAGVAALAVGLGAPPVVLVIALGLLVLANIVTVVQRSMVVYRASARREAA